MRRRGGCANDGAFVARMTFKDLPLWLHTTLTLAGLALAAGLHLAWHPLRRHFSDALDFMRTQRLPLVVMLAGWLLHGWATAPMNARTLPDWTALVQAGVFEALLLPHQAFPPWPLATLLPVWVITLAVVVMRLPYRYQTGKLGAGQQFTLVLLCLLSVSWTVLEWFVPLAQRPDFLLLPMQIARAFFTALLMAGHQVWLARLMINWEEPAADEERRADARTALHECFARWRNVLWLGLFNAVVIGFAQAQWEAAGARRWLLVLELLFVFAPLPVAVAANAGSFAKAGGAGLRTLWRAWLPLAGWAITAAVLLALTHHAVLTIADKGGAAAGILARALLLGVAHSWLLPAVLLILYRRGLKPHDQAAAD